MNNGEARELVLMAKSERMLSEATTNEEIKDIRLTAINCPSPNLNRVNNTNPNETSGLRWPHSPLG